MAVDVAVEVGEDVGTKGVAVLAGGEIAVGVEGRVGPWESDGEGV